MIFVVLALLAYEGAWAVTADMWMCASVIPLLGYILGFTIAWLSKFVMQVLVGRLKVSCIEPSAIQEFDWSECRTIGLACGLQNTQLAMSTVFGAYAMEEKVRVLPFTFLI